MRRLLGSLGEPVSEVAESLEIAKAIVKAPTPAGRKLGSGPAYCADELSSAVVAMACCYTRMDRNERHQARGYTKRLVRMLERLDQ